MEQKKKKNAVKKSGRKTVTGKSGKKAGDRARPTGRKAARSGRERTDSGKILIFDPTGGLSGDMILGSLFALGAKPAEVAAEVSGLPGLERFRIVFGRVKRQGIAAVRARVVCPHHAHARDLKRILSMIRRSKLSKKAKDLAEKTFLILGEAEGRIHGVPLGKVHFHEVGAVDSIVDIVGAVVALERLGYPKLYHRPFTLGSGMIDIAHGKLPAPAPATLEVLRGRTVRLSGQEGEVVTPTGAALMKALATELPAEAGFVPARVIYSVGTRERHPGPGMLRLVEALPSGGAGYVSAIRTTIDDMNPEIFGYLQERLFSSGALEVFVTQVLMKKNRPGSLLTVLCETGDVDRMAGLLFTETTTLGMRVSVEGRIELERFHEEVRTPYGKISVKFGRLPGSMIKFSPEYESCRKAALKAGVPVRVVYDAAMKAAGKR